MKLRRTRVTWVVVGPNPHFVIYVRCGKAEPKPELPMPANAAFRPYPTAIIKRCL